MDLLNLPRAILGLFLSFIYVLSGIRTRIVGEEGEHADHLTLSMGVSIILGAVATRIKISVSLCKIQAK